tara:strand:+ start:430 stop:582 length:153 start_codon:yes stop_codon:yes gene_type:complete
MGHTVHNLFSTKNRFRKIIVKLRFQGLLRKGITDNLLDHLPNNNRIEELL